MYRGFKITELCEVCEHRWTTCRFRCERSASRSEREATTRHTDVFLRRDNQTRLVLRWVKVNPLVAESGINATHREDWLPKARRNMQMLRPALAPRRNEEDRERERERKLSHPPLPFSPLPSPLSPSLFFCPRRLDPPSASS